MIADYHFILYGITTLRWWRNKIVIVSNFLFLVDNLIYVWKNLLLEIYRKKHHIYIISILICCILLTLNSPFWTWENFLQGIPFMIRKISKARNIIESLNIITCWWFFVISFSVILKNKMRSNYWVSMECLVIMNMNTHAKGTVMETDVSVK